MRQAGVLAAAGLVALRDGRDGMIERLADDHDNARRLAEALAELAGIVSPGGIAQPGAGPPRPGPRHDELRPVQGRARPARVPRRRSSARNVLMDEYPHGQVRAVTHNDIATSDHRDDRRRGPGSPRGDERRPSRHRPTSARSDAPGASEPRRARRPSGDAERVATRLADQEELVTDRLEDVVLTRPSAARPGPLDERLYDLVEARFRRLVRDNPVARDVRRHPHRGRPPGRRHRATRVLGELADEKAHLAAVEAIDPAGLSADGPVRARPRDPQPAADDLRHRGRPDLGAPLDRARHDRRRAVPDLRPGLRAACRSGSTRSPAGSRRSPRSSRSSKTRATVPQVRLWQRLEIESAGDLPRLFDEIVAAGSGPRRTPSDAA